MSKPKVFISYSHVDEKRWKNRLQKHLKVLERHGSLSFWDDRRITAGQEWHAEIKAALDSAAAAILLISPDFLGSDFINNEEVPVILQRRIRDGMKVFPLIVRSCPWQKVPWLKPLQARPTDGKPLAQFRGDDVDRILSELVSEIEALLNQPQPKLSAEIEIQIPAVDAQIGECPYLGLEAFTEGKKHLFFGRDDFAGALFAKVKPQNLVALIGPSGCGKSSVVQAGLFPRLWRDTQKWKIIIFPPREDPFLSLAAGFVWLWQPQVNYAVNTNEAKKLAAELKDAQRLIEAVHRTIDAADGCLLLVIDQFEELFTLCDESDRRAFLDVLLAAKDAAPLTILLTLRADFVGQAQNFSPAFSQLLDESIVNHRPFTRADLEAIITGPAQYAGLEFEPGLVDLILQEVASQPHSLPLLEYALKEMWRKRESRVMGHALYEAVGKVEGAISQHADAVLQSLPEAEQSLALRALTRLVCVAGEEGEADTRLRLPLNKLPEADREVLQKFVTARLLVTKRQEGSGVETIEVVHEALIRRWENLRKTLDSDREFLMWHRRLDYRRRAWEQKGRDDRWLLHGGEHDEAHNWLKERDAELTAAEIDFITWDDRPDFQIERILSESPSLLLPSNNETRNNWFTTLVLCREKEKALLTAREIEDVVSREMALCSIAESLATAGMATEALAVAREIENIGSRAETLRSIAEALANAGMMTEALLLAREIEVANERAKTLSSIAEVLMKAEMVMEAPAVAREIEDAGSRAETLRSIAEALANTGMVTEALVLAREIEDANGRAKALSSIAEVLTKAGTAMEALGVAREIEDANYNTKSLRSIAEALAKAGMATEALDVAREIENSYSRAETLRSIAEALAEAGMVEASEAAMEAMEGICNSIFLFNYTEELSPIVEILVKAGTSMEALAIASKIRNVDIREWTLRSIIDTLAIAGTASEMREVMTEGLNAAREIKYWGNRAGVLSSIALAMTKVGMVTEAREVATEALDAGGKMTYSDNRAGVLVSVAEALANAGMVTEALLLAREIDNDEGDRADALCLVAEAMATAGMATEAREVATEALAAAREFEYADDREFEYNAGFIAETLGKVGMATEALDAARKIKDVGSRAKTLRSIAEALMNAGMMTEALDAAREIKFASFCAETLRSIAEALAKAGMVTEALAVAREIEDAGSRAETLRSIAEGLAKAGMVTETLAIARGIEDAGFRAKTLSSIAEALANAGMVTEGLVLAREIEAAVFRAMALCSIAKALAEAGMATEALVVAREIKVANFCAEALRSIAEALMKAGLVTEMREVAMEALDAVCEIKDAYPHLQHQVLSSIAEMLMGKGLVADALIVARKFDNAYSRVKALMEVANLYIDQGQADEARNLFEEAQNAISKVFDDKLRSEVIRDLAIISARLHSYRAARDFAERCSSSSDRLAAYIAVFREYYIERDPSLAHLFVRPLIMSQQ